VRVNATPLRPTIPPIAWFAIAMWAGCSVAEHALHEPAVVRAACTGVMGLSSVAIVGYLARRLHTRGARRSTMRSESSAFHLARTTGALLLIGALAGAGVSAAQGARWSGLRAIAGDCGSRAWVGVVEADPMPGSYGQVVRVRVTGGPLDGARVRVGWPAEVAVPELGRTVRFSAILKPLPDDEPWARRVARTGAVASGNAWTAEIGPWRGDVTGPLFAWRARMLTRMHLQRGAGADLAEGIVLGDRRRLIGTPTEEDFRILGLTHLVAVSGSHLAAACAAVAFCGTLLHMPKRALVVATVMAGAAYAVVTGLPYSALRSLLMLLVAGTGAVVGRRGDGLSALAAAVVCVLALEPWAVFDLGFQLSALAVGGLLLYGNLVTAWMTAGLNGPWQLVSGTLGLTLVAQMTTVPVVASGFGMVSVLAPVANAIVGPMVSVAMLAGLTGAVIGDLLPDVGAWASGMAAAILGGAAWIASALARLPGAAVAMNGGLGLSLGTVFVAAAVWVWWPLPRTPGFARLFVAAAVCCTAVIAIGPRPATEASVCVLDVGQGDAILVRDSGRTMLVDAGPDALALRRALARTGVRGVDVLVLTHAHDDHTAGASGLNGIAEVGWIGVPRLAASEDEKASGWQTRDYMPGDSGWRGPDAGVRELTAGDTWRIGQTTVSVLWPGPDAAANLDANDTSVVLHLSRGGFDLALTGDAEALVQAQMIAAGTLAEVEVLKVPHHGSTNGLTAEGLAAWSPDVALISVGHGNDFGHPAAATLAMLDDAGVRTLRTDVSGDLLVQIGRTGYSVVTTKRGSAAAVRERIGPARARRWCAEPCILRRYPRGPRGSYLTGITQARLPHLWRGRTAPRARPPPAARSHSRGGGPGLQLRGV